MLLSNHLAYASLCRRGANYHMMNMTCKHDGVELPFVHASMFHTHLSGKLVPLSRAATSAVIAMVEARLWSRAGRAATIMFLLFFRISFYPNYVGSLSCQTPGHTDVKCGRQTLYDKTEIGCSFQSNRSRDFRAAGLHTINMYSTHSCIPGLPAKDKGAQHGLPTTNSFLYFTS